MVDPPQPRSSRPGSESLVAVLDEDDAPIAETWRHVAETAVLLAFRVRVTRTFAGSSPPRGGGVRPGASFAALREAVSVAAGRAPSCDYTLGCLPSAGRAGGRGGLRF